VITVVPGSSAAVDSQTLGLFIGEWGGLETIYPGFLHLPHHCQPPGHSELVPRVARLSLHQIGVQGITQAG